MHRRQILAWSQRRREHQAIAAPATNENAIDNKDRELRLRYQGSTSARRVIPFPDDSGDDNRRTADEGSPMSNHTYRVVEIVGSSPEGVDAAIRNGIARASRTTRGLDWFEVLEIRGQLADGAVAHVQVTMKVGFRMEDP
jgi:dodecin